MSKLYLWSEFVVLFFVIPLLYFFELIPIHKAVPLVFVFIYCLIVMYNRKSISRRIFKIKSSYPLKEVALKSLFLLVVSSIWVYIFREDVFFHLPLNNFWFSTDHWIFSEASSTNLQFLFSVSCKIIHGRSTGCP